MPPASTAATTAVRAFGLLLKRYRRAARLTQAQLAERAGFSVVYISMLERGARQPQRSTVALLADALALSPAERATLEAAAPLPSTRAGLRPEALRPPTGAFLGAAPLGPLVGRQAELAVIETTLEAVAQGEGRLLVLSGEPGIGKTRLAQEISLRARARDFRVLTGRCYEPQQSLAWYPFLEALAMAAAGIGDELHAVLAAQWPEVARLLPDQPAPAQAPTQINDRAAQQRLFWQVTSLLRALADHAPLALLLDDLHWADSASLDLLQHLARHTRDRRILLVGSYRELEVTRPLATALHDLSRDELMERITLRPLAGDETTALIGVTLGAGEGAQAGAASVSPQLARLIQQRSEGNAFFTRQLTRALQEQGDLLFEDSQWRLRATATPALHASESIRAVIGQRLARLTPPTHDILRKASILGQTFTFADLQRMCDSGEQEVEEALEEAAMAGVVREGEPDHYHFNHALTLDTLTADLSTRRKRRLHRAAAGAIEGLPNYERRTAELAYHLRAADEGARALPYVLLAGDQAEAVYAHAEAEAHYRAAATLASDLGDQARTAQALKKLGDAVYLQGRNDEAIELLERALLAYEAIGDEDGELRTLAELLEAQGLFGRETEDAAVARAQTILARLEPTDLSTLTPARAAGLAAVYRGLSAVYMPVGRADDQVRVAMRAAELARVAGDDAELAWALHRLYATGRFPDELAARHQILEMAERTGQTIVVVWCHNMLGNLYAQAGEFALAMPHMEQSLAVAEQRQDLPHLAWQLRNFAWFLLDYGDWQRARAVFARGEAIIQEVDPRGATWHAMIMSAFPANLALLEGHEDDGRRLSEQAVDRIERLGGAEFLPYLINTMAEADLLAGRIEQAEQACLRLVSVLRDVSNAHIYAPGLTVRLAWVEGVLGQYAAAEARLAPLLIGPRSLIRMDALRISGILALLQRRWDAAQVALHEALEGTRAMPYSYGEAKTLWAHGCLKAEQGDRAAARDYFKQALQICDRLGEGLYRRRIERDLAALTSSTSPTDL